MRLIRRTPRINWSDVIDNKISKKKVRSIFNNIGKIDFLIAKRCLTFLGRIIRMLDSYRLSVIRIDRKVDLGPL